jgi:hypothetical protein
LQKSKASGEADEDENTLKVGQGEYLKGVIAMDDTKFDSAYISLAVDVRDLRIDSQVRTYAEEGCVLVINRQGSSIGRESKGRGSLCCVRLGQK